MFDSFRLLKIGLAIKDKSVYYTTMDYKHGKVYKIEPIQEHEENELYVGSTCYSLNDRFINHKRAYKCNKNRVCSVFTLFDKYGINGCKISLVENFPCTSRKELCCRESYFYNELKCVNKVNPYVTPEESKERVKKWHLEHSEQRKKYIDEYVLKNYDTLSFKKLEYKKQNKEKLASQQLEKHLCGCGKSYTQCNRQRHFRTQFHIENNEYS